MSEETKEPTIISNEYVKVSICKEPGCKVKLEIEVEPIATQAAYKKALKTINKEVSIPGFRKGKAPESRVLQNHAQHVKKEWQDLVTNTAYKESLALIEIYPMGQESIKSVQVNSCDQVEGAKVSIEYESFPTIPALELENLKVEATTPKEVTDEVFEQAKKELRDVYLTHEEVEGRPIELNDFVELDIDAVEEDHSHNLCRDRMFQVAKEKMGQWMQDLVIGKSVGDVIDGTSQWEENSGLREEEFKPTQCKITIKAIKKGIYPESDEALAEKSGCKDVDDLNDKIRKDLERRMEKQSREETKEKVQALLMETYDFDLPESLLEQEKKQVAHKRLMGMRREKISDEVIEKRKEEIEAEVAKAASEELRMFFLSQKLSEQFSLKLTQEDLQQELQRQMYMVAEHDRIIDPQQMEPEQIRERLIRYLMTEKVKEHLAIALVKEKA